MTHRNSAQRSLGRACPRSPSVSVPAGEVRACLSADAAAEAYLATEVATAPPRRLQGVLYDAAIRICRQAVEALDAGQVDRADQRLGRARTIVLHLEAALPTGAAPEASAELATLYREVHRRLIEAGRYRTRETVQESIHLLHHRRPVVAAVLAAQDGPPRRARFDPAGWLG